MMKMIYACEEGNEKENEGQEVEKKRKENIIMIAIRLTTNN